MRIAPDCRKPPGHLCRGDFVRVNLFSNAARPVSMKDNKPVEAQSMLEAILHSAVGAIITIDTNGAIQSINPATVKLFGYHESELIGRNVKMLMPEPHRSRHDGYLAHHLATGERKIIGIGRDVEGLRKDGSLFPMHLSVSAFEVQGRHFFAGIVHDLSTRSRLEGEVSRQSALFQAVFDHVPEALVITDIDGRVLLVNPTANRVFGYKSEELVGQNAKVLYEDPADYVKVGNVFADLASDDKESPSPLSVRFRRKNSEAFPGQLVRAFIKNSHGTIGGILSLIRDVTRELKQDEARLKTQRLEAIGQLTGGVAHDFNNLLTIITGNLELLEDYVTDPRGANNLKRAQGAAEAGSRLTSRLLTFARRSRLESEVINLNEQVRAMLELLTRTLGDNIQLSTRLAYDLWKTKTDQSEIEGAILNLAINARDAMPKGGKLIIETSNVVLDADTPFSDGTSAPGDYVRMSVSDTGAGMSPEVLSRAFEPFFTTKPFGRGTGLGLSTIYGFVKQSNGNVLIYSEPGHGTTVHIYLPRYAADGTIDETGRANVHNGTAQGETVLVVEDNAEVRAVAVARLQRLGYHILEAETAVEAIARLSAGAAVDAVFSDVLMPGGQSGFDLARWIASNRPSLAVVLTSGFSDESMLGPQRDHAQVLRKPYTQKELELEMRKALAGKP
jgi:PAS domain S-box-containing protein